MENSRNGIGILHPRGPRTPRSIEKASANCTKGGGDQNKAERGVSGDEANRDQLAQWSQYCNASLSKLHMDVVICKRCQQIA